MIELAALEATYEGSMSVESGGSATRMPRVCVALQPQTGGDAAAAFVEATLVLQLSADYPATPPDCSWAGIKGAAALLMQCASITRPVAAAAILLWICVTSRILAAGCLRTAATAPCACSTHLRPYQFLRQQFHQPYSDVASSGACQAECNALVYCI